MTRTDELRRRVDRLLAGSTDTRDLTALFSWLRFKSYGNKTVRDIGDFVAHSDERDAGIAWRGVQGFLNITTFMIPRISGAVPEGGRRPGTLDQLKACLRSTFEVISPEDARAAFGVGYNKAKAALERALDALIGFDGETLTPRRPLTDLEAKMIERLSGVLSAIPAFTGQQLVSELITCLVKNQLLDRKPGQVPKSFDALVQLFAVERMHLTRLLLSDDKVATLNGGVSRAKELGTERIVVSASVPFTLNGVTNSIGFDVYQTTLHPLEWCAPELLTMYNVQDIGVVVEPSRWDVPLEVNHLGKLQML